MKRKASIKRKTRETEIEVELTLDGSGTCDAQTGVPFFDHLLDSFSRHGFFDLKVRATGDLEVDQHHTVEDVGIVLGQALREAVGDGSGLARFGSSRVPMADVLVQVDLDLSNRPYLVYGVALSRDWVGQFDAALVEDFLYALTTNGGVDLHVQLVYGHNVHHSVEAIFKGLGRALDQATRTDPRLEGALSTKGSL
ncbi:MAG: imidazoleglycerol-phosphate dehydratase HisB [Deltaproteobacteria bacterium]|nr:imidazoleglycerol-phosphate dehydratase HisB [Deltaproteobacteria bacterium]